jgi:hypothetical protein
MFGVGLVGVLVLWVALVAWRALRGPAPDGPVRFSVVAAVSAVIHLGFHAAATAAPTLDAVALVLAGWSTFGCWCLWLGRVPGHGFRQNEDEGGEDGGGGGPGNDPDDRPGPSGGDDDRFDWDAFDRDFAAYVEGADRPRAEPDLEPAAE